MPDRCLNLKDWEARAMEAGASVLVRPVPLTVRDGTEVALMKDLGGGLWASIVRQVDAAGTKSCALHSRIKAPLAPGDTAILREAWFRFYDTALGWNVIYRADRPQWWGDIKWRTPQTMPASLARWRKPVVSVEAEQRDEGWVWVVRFGEVSSE